MLVAAGAVAAQTPGAAERILRARCHGCHGESQQLGGLRLDSREAVLRGGKTGAAVVAGAPGRSRLIAAVTTGVASGSKTMVMPPVGKPLPPEEVDTLRRWVAAGAPFTGSVRHWAFQPVANPAPPVVRGAAWVRGPIDRFVLARLEREGIAPSGEASQRTLLRRLYLDLTGLLPTPEEQAAFLADTRNDSYERLVAKLLESPHYGEKWARPWLDLVRYADSEGGIQDYPRPFAWRYREWVIGALNQDMGYDRFTVEQLAGDLLPARGLAQRIAAGYNRQTITSREGGIDLERLRFEQLVDRAATTSTVWLGLTAGCAQCHDHKYDPITQRDFYGLMAFFQDGQEVDAEAPLPGEIGAYLKTVNEYRGERARLLESHCVAAEQAGWEEKLRSAHAHPGEHVDWDVAFDSYSKIVDHGVRILLTAPEKRSTREQDTITDHFVRNSARLIGQKRWEALGYRDLGAQLEKLAAKYPALSLINTFEDDGAGRPTHIALRGNYKERGDRVEASTPTFLGGAARGTRLDLARWMVSRANPLAARVAVNRVWQELFGQGLSPTPEDFGRQGEPPSHPELLDWLATGFMEHRWSFKWLIREVVLSAAYRQRSDIRPELAVRDPGNTLLARQSRPRLPAELIRDVALGASGLLNTAVGGESVRPPQPDGVTDLAYSMKWTETAGAAVYKRGIYVQLQRTAHYPLLMNFDAPDRTAACARRERSNTPLQALNLMNDPVFVEAAQALAARLMREKQTEAARIGHAFELCFQRPPSATEADLVASHLARRRELAKKDPASIAALPVASLPGVAPEEMAAWFGVSRGLLASSEMVTRE